VGWKVADVYSSIVWLHLGQISDCTYSNYTRFACNEFPVFWWQLWSAWGDRVVMRPVCCMCRVVLHPNSVMSMLLLRRIPRESQVSVLFCCLYCSCRLW